MSVINGIIQPELKYHYYQKIYEFAVELIKQLICNSVKVNVDQMGNWKPMTSCG